MSGILYPNTCKLCLDLAQVAFKWIKKHINTFIKKKEQTFGSDMKLKKDLIILGYFCFYGYGLTNAISVHLQWMQCKAPGFTNSHKTNNSVDLKV